MPPVQVVPLTDPAQIHSIIMQHINNDQNLANYVKKMSMMTNQKPNVALSRIMKIDCKSKIKFKFFQTLPTQSPKGLQPDSSEIQRVKKYQNYIADICLEEDIMKFYQR